MQSESGSMFNQTSYQPLRQEPNIPQPKQSPFNLYTTPESFSTPNNLAQSQNPLNFQQNTSFKSNQTFTLPSSLVPNMKQANKLQIENLRQENLQKYNISKNSPIYNIPLYRLGHIITKFPSQFPSTLIDEIQQIKNSYSSSHDFFRNLCRTGVLYWILLRRLNWFQLTGKPQGRLFFIMYTFSSAYRVHQQSVQQVNHKIFLNHQYFQNVIRKYNINKQNFGRLKLLS